MAQPELRGAFSMSTIAATGLLVLPVPGLPFPPADLSL